MSLWLATPFTRTEAASWFSPRCVGVPHSTVRGRRALPFLVVLVDAARLCVSGDRASSALIAGVSYVFAFGGFCRARDCPLLAELGHRRVTENDNHASRATAEERR
jgi:hypothetical protein